jgi:hypothetical protein
MQVNAMSSAMVGMRRASTMLDTAAAQIAGDGSVSVTINASTPSSAMPTDNLLTSVPNLLMAGTLFASTAFVTRVAHESYRTALDLLPVDDGELCAGGR